jgi:CRP/FNR family cyclic AMP-dependent transcriptional regulator
VNIVEIDPDLGAGLDPSVRAQAGRLSRTPSLNVARGPWMPPQDPGAAQGLGVLVLEGLFLRDVLLLDIRCSELIGQGDVVEPTDLGTPNRLCLVDIEWAVLEDARVAILDARFVALAARWPALVSALFARVAERSFRLGTQAAICQLARVELRLLAAMWHLAERWGRVSSDGVLLPLKLSHASLGRVVGARRPTVSLAMKALSDDGTVLRRTDGTWLLHGEPPG